MSVSCSASIVINEIDYAQQGTDNAEFIELLNTGTSTVNLDELSLVLIDGTGGGAALYNSINLPDFDLQPGKHFVVCGDSSNVLNCNMHLGLTDFLRDGSPDAIALTLGSTQLDAVSYNGNSGAPYTEGSGVQILVRIVALRAFPTHHRHRAVRSSMTVALMLLLLLRELEYRSAT
jgi:hypothetical protein